MRPVGASGSIPADFLGQPDRRQRGRFRRAPGEAARLLPGWRWQAGRERRWATRAVGDALRLQRWPARAADRLLQEGTRDSTPAIARAYSNVGDALQDRGAVGPRRSSYSRQRRSSSTPTMPGLHPRPRQRPACEGPAGRGSAMHLPSGRSGSTRITRQVRNGISKRPVVVHAGPRCTSGGAEAASTANPREHEAPGLPDTRSHALFLGQDAELPRHCCRSAGGRLRRGRPHPSSPSPSAGAWLLLAGRGGRAGAGGLLIDRAVAAKEFDSRAWIYRFFSLRQGPGRISSRPIRAAISLMEGEASRGVRTGACPPPDPGHGPRS